MSVIAADILQRHGHPVQRLTLRTRTAYSFRAGQYLHVKGTACDIPLSIASAPERLPELELHYRSVPGLPEALEMDKLLAGDALMLTAAAGEVSCDAARQPLLLIAGGSGAAQAFSCAEHRASQIQLETSMLWCADHADDVYERERLATWLNGSLQVCIDHRRDSCNTGLAWVRDNRHALQHHQIILCGSPSFVYAMTDTLLEGGCERQQLQSDVYTYAPRDC